MVALDRAAEPKDVARGHFMHVAARSVNAAGPVTSA